jgi:hypothetical protein
MILTPVITIFLPAYALAAVRPFDCITYDLRHNKTTGFNRIGGQRHL